ncbi:MAG: penicillin-binding protein 2 [Candidatus Brocadiaceae bacterium]|nr:penicillin-binding protein 2 [Candidatus Brocadiaceae bacterium]
MGDEGRAGRGLRIRAGAAMALVLVAFLLLAGRLGQMQISQGAEYRRLADQQQMLDRELAAWRGRILDSRGRLLASTVQRWSVYADPQAIADPDGAAVLLGSTLDLPVGRLRERLARDRSFVWIKRQVTEREADAVRGLALPGIHMRRESKRLYPQGRLAAHVIGFTDIDGRGLAGIEARMDALLRGRPGSESVLCDGGRRIICPPAGNRTREPFDGFDVQLTLDAYVQAIAEEELAAAVRSHQPECATALVMDVLDGSLLAMASWPDFDPQAPADSPVRNQRNVAICDAYEFGSSFKPVVAALALEDGTVRPETTFDCHQGRWRIGRRTLNDVHAYGLLTVSDILCHSSNIGMAQVSMALGLERLYAGIRRFGFGRPTGIALPGESGGIMRPFRTWNDYSVVSVSFGQELAVTALSLVRAFAALANGGRLPQPHIVRSIRHTTTGREIYSASGALGATHPVSAATSGQVLTMMRRVVEEGTGRQAISAEYALAGKTGTAQLLTEDGRGYSNSRHLSTFVAVGPVPDCRIAVLVTLKAPTRHGYYGGTVAGPAVRNICLRTLRHLRVPPSEPSPILALGAHP